MPISGCRRSAGTASRAAIEGHSQHGQRQRVDERLADAIDSAQRDQCVGPRDHRAEHGREHHAASAQQHETLAAVEVAERPAGEDEVC